MEFLILLIVALVISSIGFKKFVWFISIGYGFSITGLGITMLWMFRNQLTPVTVILSVLCIIYGARLGGYLLIREKKSASYQKTMKDDIKDGSDMNLFLKILLQYLILLLSIVFHLKNFLYL